MQKQYSNKDQLKHLATPQEAADETLNQTADSDLSLTAIRSWCANPDSCLTDCKTYCKKLKQVK